MLPLRCVQCSSIFWLNQKRVRAAVNPKHHNTGEYCSVVCRNAHQNTQIDVTCTQCNAILRRQQCQAKRYPNHFCGSSCAARYNNAHKTHGTRVSKLELWLQAQLPTLYPNLEFHFNRRDAIQGELDIYIPSLKLAFELNGIFHYEPIYGADKLTSIQDNDQRKFQACLEHGIEMCLIDVTTMKNFKEPGARKFLTIIQGVINVKEKPKDQSLLAAMSSSDDVLLFSPA